MLFNTWTFAAFLIAVLSTYYFTPCLRKYALFQVTLLTIASYVFYAWHAPWLVIVLAFSTTINAWATVVLFCAPTASNQKQFSRKILLIAVLGNLLVLAVFKYASLLVETFLPQAMHRPWGVDLKNIPLPIGISFFTFQGISLVVDVYRKTQNVDQLSWENADQLTSGKSSSRGKVIADIAFFKAFFPQLVAGPIVKAHQFMEQIGMKEFRNIQWESAVKTLITGFFFKMVIADNLREVTAGLSFPAFTEMPGVNLLFLLYAFSFQIFADFFGYSMIAIGLAKLFGYELPANFNFPYISTSITEFWRRWHISLSSWLREYLYIPLGGNRLGAVRTYLNLIVVMLLGGLWHGAAWKFMFWGGAHGTCLALERLFQAQKNRTHAMNHLIQVVRMLLVFHLVSALWLLFQLDDLHQGWLFVKRLSHWPSGFSPQPIFCCVVFGLGVVGYHALGWFREQKQLAIHSSSLGNILYGTLLFLILTNSGVSGAFIYFQF